MASDSTNTTHGDAAWSVLVLTMGDRPAHVDALTRSLDGFDFEGVLLANGSDDVVAPPGWRLESSVENLGISGGRRRVAEYATGDYLLFVDDDCALSAPDAAAMFDLLTRRFEQAPELGAIAVRIVSDDDGTTLREWSPRTGSSGIDEPGQVTSFVGGAHAVRAAAYRQVGGYQPDFWYAHEETDLAWRLLDAGWQIEYQPEVRFSHPPAAPSRHDAHLWYSARNRVWVARRNLPWPLAAVYLSVWGAAQTVRCRTVGELRQVVAGTRAGFREMSGERRPMSWSTAWRMTRLGRPPLW